MKTSFLAVTAGLAASAAFAQNAPAQADNEWYTQAESTIQEKLAVKANTNRARNVILMVSDGNSIASNYATRLYQGQQEGDYGDSNVLPQEEFPHLALSKTYNTNAQTPDSAGTAAAILTGVKTKAGVLGIDASASRGVCGGAADASVDTLAEMLSEQGKSAGFVTTARATHATPGSTYAHIADRNWENDSDIPEGCETPDIASQLLSAMEDGTIDVAMGGGRREFIGKDAEGDEGEAGQRSDGRDLIQEAEDMGAHYAWNTETFDQLSGETPVLGLFEPSHMHYEADRGEDEPSLAQMTEKAITALQGNEDGYFLLVEGGRVDHANHDGNAYRMVTDGVAFADAVQTVADMTDPEDTLVVVTADHGHTLQMNGYCGRGTDILGLCMAIDPKNTEHADEPLEGANGKPFTVIGYLNGPGSVFYEDEEEQSAESGSGDMAEDEGSGRPVVTQEEATDPDYLQQALVPKDSESHSGADVAIYARGPFSQLFDGTVEQNYIFHVMLHAATADPGR